MRERVEVDFLTYKNSDTGFEDLKLAVAKLTTASEEQFEQIKKEKWYNRVWDMVTFSKKNEKRLAQQIGNLAQAQIILMEILLRLADQDEKVAQLVSEYSDVIKELQEQDIRLQECVNKIMNVHILGLTKAVDLKELSMKAKEVLSACLIYMAEVYSNISVEQQTSAEQQAYANSVLRYIDVDADLEELGLAIGDIDERSRKLVLRCCMEYMYLYECTSTIPEELEELVDEFDFGNKTLRETWKQIEKAVKLRGIDGIVYKYSSDNFDNDYDDFFEIEYEETFEENVYIDDADQVIDSNADAIWMHWDNTEEKEELRIRLTKGIEANDGEVIENRDVFISSIINCEGELGLINCRIFLDSSTLNGSITLSNGGKLYIGNCEIIYKNDRSLPFINAQRDSQIIIEHSTFWKCYNFINLDYAYVCGIEDSKFLNCHGNIIKGSLKSEGALEVTNSYFEINGRENLKDNSKELESIIDITKFYSSDEPCLIENCTIIQEDKDIAINVFNIKDGIYKNCLFKNVISCVQGAALIESCKFDRCCKVGNIEKEGCIQKSLFYRCYTALPYNMSKSDVYWIRELDKKALIQANSNVKMEQCKFYKCDGPIWRHDGYYGGHNISFCDFYDIKSDHDKSIPLLQFYVNSDREYRNDTIRKCTFTNISVGNGYIVGAKIYSDPKMHRVYLDECLFDKCVTKRPDCELVQKLGYYYGRFGSKQKEARVAEVGSKCVGYNKSLTKESALPQETVTALEALWDEMNVGCGEGLYEYVYEECIYYENLYGVDSSFN